MIISYVQTEECYYPLHRHRRRRLIRYDKCPTMVIEPLSFPQAKKQKNIHSSEIWSGFILFYFLHKAKKSPSLSFFFLFWVQWYYISERVYHQEFSWYFIWFYPTKHNYQFLFQIHQISRPRKDFRKKKIIFDVRKYKYMLHSQLRKFWIEITTTKRRTKNQQKRDFYYKVLYRVKKVRFLPRTKSTYKYTSLFVVSFSCPSNFFSFQWRKIIQGYCQ